MLKGGKGWLSQIPVASPESKYKRQLKHVTNVLELLNVQGSSTLFDYQIKALLNAKGLDTMDEARRYLEGNLPTEPILIVAPTGAGKSGIIVLLPYVLNSARVLVLTPSLVFTEKLRTAFGAHINRSSFLEYAGLIDSKNEATLDAFLEPVHAITSAKDLTQRFGKLCIVNAQTFGDHPKPNLMHKKKEIIADTEEFFNKFDTLIVDEAHHYPAKTWEDLVREFSKLPADGSVKRKKIVFLTATPYENIRGKMSFLTGDEAEKRIAHNITPEMVQGRTIRPTEFREKKDDDGLMDQVLRDLLEIFAENQKREPRLVLPKAMILVRTKKDAYNLVYFLNNETQKDDFAIAAVAEKQDSFDKFTKGKHQVLVTCGIGKDGYENADVVACVILRNIVKGRILFSQFVGCCMRLHKGLLGEAADKSVGIVLSYQKFNQKKMWDEREQLAESDPIDIDELNL